MAKSFSLDWQNLDTMLQMDRWGKPLFSHFLCKGLEISEERISNTESSTQANLMRIVDG